MKINCTTAFSGRKAAVHERVRFNLELPQTTKTKLENLSRERGYQSVTEGLRHCVNALDWINTEEKNDRVLFTVSESVLPQILKKTTTDIRQLVLIA